MDEWAEWMADELEYRGSCHAVYDSRQLSLRRETYRA